MEPNQDMDMEMEWSMLNTTISEWSEEDLQLAAELGKTLLERNKELEALVKCQVTTIDDQAQEIEYLTKQTAALREVNDSRLRIYEQLEVSIQDLERANHRLALENSADKKHIKSLNATVESLEAKCEDLQGVIDELRIQVDGLRKRTQQRAESETTYTNKEYINLRHVTKDDRVSPDITAPKNEVYSANSSSSSSSTKTLSPPKQKQEEPPAQNGEETDPGIDVAALMAQLRETRSQLCREERRSAELEEQLSTMVQQNQALENQVVELHHKNDDVKSMHEELNTLEEVRQGQMCARCLRNVDASSSIPEDDDSSMLEALMNESQYRSSFYMEVQGSPAVPQSSPMVHSSPSTKKENPYKVLVEKYEALVEVHRQPIRTSLQEDIPTSGEFNTLSTKDTDEESGHGDSLQPEGVQQHKKTRKTVSHTPTDFSEAETSSSGFSDETSNKATQTEGKVGSFLCTIGDGDDCKFTIYDDANPIETRFRSRPEYQKLFKEIFTVLKRAAETKDEEEKLPQLDDLTPVKNVPKVPPVTPSNDQLPDFPDDDTQSILSSTMSEMSTSQNEPTTVIENIIQSQNEPIPEPETPANTSNERVLRPLVRQQNDYICEGRKRSSSRRKNKFLDRSDSPVTHIIGSPKINYSSRPNSGRRRREMKNASLDSLETNWNGNTLHFTRSAPRNLPSPTPSQGSGKGVIEFKPSSASQDLHKLRKLEQSYADVLRNADTRKREMIMRHRKK
ncbi:cerebellar degeneration-related protein 2-like isoform X3 [Aethina tumida]|uniref:cerebellar degeneration-related protein 2-like isoform X3 n=1 Tax=Aethina tumida TaxID=116153 RepID=UPI002147BFDB|nr:cerebellar degeneration-related protein 2-like isoform X3 [Aethina tumida]